MSKKEIRILREAAYAANLGFQENSNGVTFFRDIGEENCQQVFCEDFRDAVAEIDPS